MEQAKELCEIIKTRTVDTKTFTKLDELFEYFSYKYFIPKLDGVDGGYIKVKSTTLAKYVGWFCAEYEFLWNDLNSSVFEREEIVKTISGKALKSFKCFLSQHSGKTKATKASNTGTTNTTRSAGQPQNNFKSRGALSNVAVDLIGTPNQKIHLSTPIYCVNGVDANGTVLEDTAYIRPVEADANAQARYTINNTNKVLFGKAKGYGYCQVYFTSSTDAADFAAKLNASNPKVNSNVTDIKVCQLKSALANGYFKIGTEFGPVYISASKLNESIQEALQEATKAEEQSTGSNREAWKHYIEAYFHEL